MTSQQAHKQAAKQSKTAGAQYVVYVFDQGTDIYNAEQCRRYAPLIQIDACYIDGVLVADSGVTA